MPRRVGHPCAAPGCAGVVRGAAYCPEHQPARSTASRLSPSRRGYDRRWQRLRRMVLAQQPFCVACEREGRVTPATDVDHIVPLADGGRDEWSNLQPLCHSCHSRKTAAAGGRGAKPL